MDFRALAEKASALCPQGIGSSGPVSGRVLAIDGDALAYFCAGNDNTDVGQARINVYERIKTALAASGAEEVRLLVTAQGSCKGDRYAVARVQPYQGQRTGGNRPKNWEYIRQLLNSTYIDYGCGKAYITQETYFEADDAFKRLSDQLGPENLVIHCQDKDMRMIPGHHLDWETYGMFYLSPDVWHTVFNDKVYGRSWFWHQMMHGDGADNIPGLLFYTDGSTYKTGAKKGQIKEIKCGVKAEILSRIPEVGSDERMCEFLFPLYESCYGKDALVAMLEQGILLWLRTDPDKFDVAAPGNPLEELRTLPDWVRITSALNKRIWEHLDAPT